MPFLSSSFDLPQPPSISPSSVEEAAELHVSSTKTPKWRRIVSKMRFDKPETTAICFCAAAKGLVVAAPTLDILYGGFPPQTKAIITIPLVLYQAEQVAVAQMLVWFFKRWNSKPDRLKRPTPLGQNGNGQRLDDPSNSGPEGEGRTAGDAVEVKPHR